MKTPRTGNSNNFCLPQQELEDLPTALRSEDIAYAIIINISTFSDLISLANTCKTIKNHFKLGLFKQINTLISCYFLIPKLNCHNSFKNAVLLTSELEKQSLPDTPKFLFTILKTEIFYLFSEFKPQKIKDFCWNKCTLEVCTFLATALKIKFLGIIDGLKFDQLCAHYKFSKEEMAEGANYYEEAEKILKERTVDISKLTEKHKKTAEIEAKYFRLALVEGDEHDETNADFCLPTLKPTFKDLQELYDNPLLDQRHQARLQARSLRKLQCGEVDGVTINDFFSICNSIINNPHAFPDDQREAIIGIALSYAAGLIPIKDQYPVIWGLLESLAVDPSKIDTYTYSWHIQENRFCKSIFYSKFIDHSAGTNKLETLIQTGVHEGTIRSELYNSLFFMRNLIRRFDDYPSADHLESIWLNTPDSPSYLFTVALKLATWHYHHDDPPKSNYTTCISLLQAIIEGAQEVSYSERVMLEKSVLLAKFYMARLCLEKKVGELTHEKACEYLQEVVKSLHMGFSYKNTAVEILAQTYGKTEDGVINQIG